MSDARLRLLERKWRETGAVDDEAAYLRELVRVGGLARGRVELASAWHEPARIALDLPLISGATFRERLPLTERANGPRDLALLAAAFFWPVALAWARQRPSDTRVQGALAALERWIEDPSPSAEALAYSAGDAANRAFDELQSGAIQVQDAGAGLVLQELAETAAIVGWIAPGGTNQASLAREAIERSVQLHHALGMVRGDSEFAKEPVIDYLLQRTSGGRY